MIHVGYKSVLLLTNPTTFLLHNCTLNNEIKLFADDNYFSHPSPCPQMFDAPFMSLRFLSDGKTICVLLSLFPGLVRKGKINVRGSSQIARECVKATSEGSANKSRAWMFVGWVIYRSFSLLSQSRRKKIKRKFHRHSYKKKKTFIDFNLQLRRQKVY